MAWVNDYKPPTPVSLSEAELYGPEPYDVNFTFPLHPESLESDRVKLVPFIPRVHGEAHWDVMSQHYQTLYKYYAVIHTTQEAFLSFLETDVRQHPETVLFAIIDKTKPDPGHPGLGGSLAGIVGMLFTSLQHLFTEIGFIMVYPAFQRTHVATNAVGILLKYCLEPPSASPPGIGLRRVQWHCHWRNSASKKLAERMGMKFEGTLKWYGVLPEGAAETIEVANREGDPSPNNPGRHTDSLAICWDQWVQDGERERVQSIIDRKA